MQAWLGANDVKGLSVCEVLLSRGGWWTEKNVHGEPRVGRAEVFLSHVQLEHPDETMDAVNNIHSRLGVARRGTKHMGSRIWLE